MADERKYINTTELLKGAERLIEQLEREWPAEQYSNQHEMLLMAAYALIGPTGWRYAVDQF